MNKWKKNLFKCPLNFLNKKNQVSTSILFY